MDKLNEKIYNTNNDLIDIVSSPLVKLMIGDEVMISEDALVKYRDVVFREELGINYNENSVKFLDYHLKNKTTLVVLEKFKFNLESPRFPWWSMFDIEGELLDQLNIVNIYIPDTLLINERKPNYKPKTFVRENNDIIINEAIEEFKSDYYITGEETVEEIEKHYNISFNGYFNDLYESKSDDTWYPYRFKTEEEMINDYGNFWENNEFGGTFWSEDMNNLLGEPFPYTKDELDFDVNEPIDDVYTDRNGYEWRISWGMLTKVENDKPNYKPKQIIRESNIKKLGEF